MGFVRWGAKCLFSWRLYCSITSGDQYCILASAKTKDYLLPNQSSHISHSRLFVLDDSYSPSYNFISLRHLYPMSSCERQLVPVLSSASFLKFSEIITSIIRMSICHTLNSPAVKKWQKQTFKPVHSNRILWWRYVNWNKKLIGETCFIWVGNLSKLVVIVGKVSIIFVMTCQRSSYYHSLCILTDFS